MSEETSKPQDEKTEQPTERPVERPVEEMTEETLEQVNGGYQTGGSPNFNKKVLRWFPIDQGPFQKPFSSFDKI